MRACISMCGLSNSSHSQDGYAVDWVMQGRMLLVLATGGCRARRQGLVSYGTWVSMAISVYSVQGLLLTSCEGKLLTHSSVGCSSQTQERRLENGRSLSFFTPTVCS
jgi:hypothetical protein